MIERVSPGARVPPHVALMEEIEKRRGEFTVKASGLSPLLDMIAAYVAATHARLELLEGMGGAVTQFSGQLGAEATR